MQHDPMDQALSRLYETQPPPPGFETGWRAAVRREESLQMNHPKKIVFPWKKIVPVLAVLVLVLGGLWTGAADLPLKAPQTTQPPALMVSRTADTGHQEEAAAYDMASSASSSANGLGTTDGLTVYGAETSGEGRKLVRTADVTLNTQTFDESLACVQALVQETGGYVENLYQYGDTMRRIHLGLRIPAGQLDAFLSGVGGAGRVTSRSESTSDMTVQYADNAARLETLYAKRARLNELLAAAEDVSDLIEIESAIADTQYQIDSYESAQRSIDQRADMSAVSLTLVEETPGETAAADVSLGERIRAALSASLSWTGDFLRNVVVFAVMILPAAAAVGAAALVIWLIRSKKKKEK